MQPQCSIVNLLQLIIIIIIIIIIMLQMYIVVRQEHRCYQLQQGPQMIFTQIAFTLGSMQVSNERLELGK